MRIAIYGTGGVGGYFGGRLAQAGHSVAFLARGAQLAALRTGGLRVESIAGDFVVAPVEAASDPSRLGPVEVVLVCVKSWQVRAVAAAMAPLLGAETFAVPLCNGVDAADDLAREIGARRVVPGLCRIVSFVGAPGVIRHAAIEPSVEFGETSGEPSRRTEGLRAAFAAARGLTARVSADIQVALWEKFLFIAPFSGVGAYTGFAAGTMRTDSTARVLLSDAMREVAAVAAARGVPLREDAVERTLGFVDKMPPDATASMQRDILAGRPSELEQQNGAVVRLGRQAGVDTPVNARIFDALSLREYAARRRAGLA